MRCDLNSYGDECLLSDGGLSDGADADDLNAAGYPLHPGSGIEHLEGGSITRRGMLIVVDALVNYAPRCELSGYFTLRETTLASQSWCVLPHAHADPDEEELLHRQWQSRRGSDCALLL